MKTAEEVLNDWVMPHWIQQEGLKDRILEAMKDYGRAIGQETLINAEGKAHCHLSELPLNLHLRISASITETEIITP